MFQVVSHDDAPATDRPPVDPQTLSRLRTSLIRALRVSPEGREPLCDALEMLEGIQQRIEQAPPREARKSRDKSSRPEYQVQRDLDEQTPVLIERRAGKSQPFRCPQPVYRAAASVLAHAKDPLYFEQIMDHLTEVLGQRQPDYRLRMVLRFWTAGGLVTRSNHRYYPAEAAHFLDAAESAWKGATVA